MSIRWKLFGVSNYILLLFYLIILVVTIRGLSSSEAVRGLLPITISALFIILNAASNIYIYHKHLPDKPMSKAGNKRYLVSTIMYTLSLAVILFYLIPESITAIRSNTIDSFFYFILFVDAINLVALFVLLLQYSAGRMIEKNYRNKISNQLMELGEEN